MANSGNKIGGGQNAQHGAKTAGKTDPEQSPDEFDLASDLKGNNSLQGEDQERAPSQRQAQAEATGETQSTLEAITGQQSPEDDIHDNAAGGGNIAHIGDERAQQLPGNSGGSGWIDRNDGVRQRAYQIWEEEGRPDGQHEAHWMRAERELHSDLDPAERAAKNR